MCSLLDNKYCDFFFLDGLSLGATARLIGVNYTEALKDPNSDEYELFCDSVITEV